MRSFLGRHKALSIILALALVLTLPLAGWVWYLNRQLSDIQRFSAEPPGGEGSAVVRPERPAGEAVNILLLGADDPNGVDTGPSLEQVLSGGSWDAGEFRSDTMIVLHLADDRRGAQLVSLPRDSWVEVPGHGSNKLNAAFSYGGPALMKQTVEQVTGLYLHHVMIVDFAGFEEITRIVDGVDVHVPRTVTDTMHDKTWTQGTHTLQGPEALHYVRQRYGLPGGDFDRMHRQQNFLRALIDKMTSRGVLTNPVRLTNLAEELADTVAVDDELTPGRIRELALSMRSFQMDQMEFLTAPHNGTGRVGSASVVHLDVGKTREMFTAIGANRFDEWRENNEAELLPETGEVN